MPSVLQSVTQMDCIGAILLALHMESAHGLNVSGCLKLSKTIFIQGKSILA